MLTKFKHGQTIYFAPDLKEGVQKIADAEGRSFTKQVERALREWWLAMREQEREKEEAAASLEF
jgi:hypothetical protein